MIISCKYIGEERRDDIDRSSSTRKKGIDTNVDRSCFLSKLLLNEPFGERKFKTIGNVKTQNERIFDT